VLLEVGLKVVFCVMLCYVTVSVIVFSPVTFIFCSLTGPSLASDTISSLSLPSDYRSMSLGGGDEVSPETQDQSDAASSAGAFGNMMYIDYPMGLNKSKEHTLIVFIFPERQIVIETHVCLLSVCQNCLNMCNLLFYLCVYMDTCMSCLT